MDLDRGVDRLPEYVDRDKLCGPKHPEESCFPLERDDQFTVMLVSAGEPEGHPLSIGPCAAIAEGELYSIDIEIDYEVVVGGVLSQKTDSGAIHVAGDP